MYTVHITTQGALLFLLPPPHQNTGRCIQHARVYIKMNKIKGDHTQQLQDEKCTRDLSGCLTIGLNVCGQMYININRSSQLYDKKSYVYDVLHCEIMPLMIGKYQ